MAVTNAGLKLTNERHGHKNHAKKENVRFRTSIIKPAFIEGPICAHQLP